VLGRDPVELVLLGREEIHEQRPEPGLVQLRGDLAVARAVPPGPAAVGEDDDPGGTVRKDEVAFEHDVAGRDVDSGRDAQFDPPSRSAA
jgi:hypothetical protein